MQKRLITVPQFLSKVLNGLGPTITPIPSPKMSRVGLFGQISEINDHLYLSGAGVLRPEKLRQKKITCVVNATTEEPSAYMTGKGF